MRVDKWLWTARLFKTRGLAAGAVTGGRVHVNGMAVKPSRDVGPGDELQITIGHVRRTVIVRGAAERRVSAPEAAKLYDETAESVAERERQARASPARRADRPRRAPDQARPPPLPREHKARPSAPWLMVLRSRSRGLASVIASSVETPAPLSLR